MQATPILQFGTSRFLQAHADLFVSQAMAQGQNVGPITVVQSSGDAARHSRLAGLVGSYPVRIEGRADGVSLQEALQVNSVTRTLSTATDWPEVCRVFAQEAEIVLSNTGDSGYAPQEGDGGAGFEQHMSYPAKLTLLLRHRFAHGAASIQIMPMELIADNGAVLKRRVLDLAGQDDPALRAYLCEQVIWVNSLVDRIVSQPLEPAGAVAEPYALWAIEDQPNLAVPCAHPAVQVVPSLARIEALKLFVLNLGHSVFADRWLGRQKQGQGQEQGQADVYVRQLMEDPVEVGALKAVLQDEVRPAFVAAGLEAEIDPYIATTLERFANPYLDQKIADIAQNHPQKVDRRIAALLEWAARHGDVSDKPVLSSIVERHKDQAP
ncbi:mannitol dehydrogenase family protein [uncultured Litoreibacter sp.]|uniref:mannitol dehydrogenase family protein n=1 Tax=uncultured Litoreibacter sp. TaxID=1392394 RepID=UPI002639093C|nr:mannitol dehydrogenase family protein [uncultured Litoreibacter sp.]